MPILAGLGPLGVPELLIIAFIVVLVFGVGRLPEVGGALGKGIREFRKSAEDGGDDKPVDASAAPAADASAPAATAAPAAPAASGNAVFCGECGAKNAGGVKFCSSCGHAIAAAVS